jgi:flagellar biosynthetic protein FliP
MKRRIHKTVLLLLFIILISGIFITPVFSADNAEITVAAPDMAQSMQILLLLTVLSVAPSIILMMTSFTRITIVFSFVRNGLGLQQTPPNQVLVGLALFLSLFIMMPVVKEVNEEAYKPYINGEITQSEAFDAAMKPIRTFMLEQTNKQEMKLFLNLSGKDSVGDYNDIPTETLIPAFVLSELKKAFIMGFMILIPFLIIDMVVASALMSMGMIMVPPAVISLPFKLILFVVVDGWSLIIKTLVLSFS